MRIALAVFVLAGLFTAHAVDRFVSLNGGHAPPFTSWADAATNIQEAVDVAVAGDTIWVTNGLYNTGGKVMAGNLTNRVALDKAVTLRSVNGPTSTIIEGVPPGGTAPVRCVWMTNGAVLSGFLVRRGLTPASGDTLEVQSGGGVWCASANAVVTNCYLAWNQAQYRSGGVHGGTVLNSKLIANGSTLFGGAAAGATLRNCVIEGNRATSGAGTYLGVLANCALLGNTATSFGGGTYEGTLRNCNVIGNCAGTAGGGMYAFALSHGVALNCIVYDNVSGSLALSSNYHPNSVAFTNSCTAPIPTGSLAGPGNINLDPQLLSDSIHLAPASPCRAAGSPNYVVGVDLDSQPWLTPPSMGCDEVYETGLTGPLAVAIEVTDTNVVQGVPLSLIGVIDGLPSGLEWDFDDGMVSSNLSYLTAHTWTNPGDYTVTFTAFNGDNPGGVSTNVTIHVVPLLQPQLSVVSLSSNTFTLNLATQPGVNYAVEQTTNLAPPVVWNPVHTMTGTGDDLPVTDTAATNEMRLYRARVP